MSAEPSATDIAIVGMSVRVPGARDYRAFWRNLRDGVESIRRYTDEELLAAGEQPDALHDPNYVRAGAPLEGMESFDGEFFGFSPKESAILDPQHRHFLAACWEALEDAGHPPEAFPGPVGVFGGCGMGSYFYFHLCTNPELVRDVGLFLLRHTGNDKDFLATRVSHLLNLTGPSVNVQTACSTSLVAVHLACQSLLAGECDLALAGGVTIELPHRRGYVFRDNEILSPDGHCHAFDHRAKGTVFGSGVGVVALRPLRDAIRDRDHIHAVIRGSAVNNDGASKAGYLAPSVDGQAAAVVEALAAAGVEAGTIDYVECHGTGTYLGDPIEVAALTQAFRRSSVRPGRCRIGSVKTNIGHLDTAAGVVALVKATLALEHGELPPSLNFERPNPDIDFASSPFTVNDRLTPWPRENRPRRAAVNSLGVGGTNAHAILEQAPAVPPSAPTRDAFQTFMLSARTRPALDEACDRLAAHLEANPTASLADVAFTLKEGRRAFARRRVLAARDAAEAIALLRSRDPARVFTHAATGTGTPEVTFLFPGGGAQHPNMGRDLYDAEPVFREWVDRGLRALAAEPGGAELRALLFPAQDALEQARRALGRPSAQLPLLFIVEHALAQLLRSRGLEPSSVAGHSMGENTAACVAGVFTFEHALGLVALRGRLFDGVPSGGMLSVPLSPAELEGILAEHPELDLACVNAPGLCVVSGPREPLDRLQQALAARDVDAPRIPIDIAAHSRMLDGILDPFRAYLRRIPLRAPKLPLLSNLTGTWTTERDATDPEYWVRHLRHTVNFAGDVATLAASPSAVLLEVGPSKVLGSLAKQCPGIDGGRVIATMRHPDESIDDRAAFATALGRLWAVGVDLSADRLWPGEARRRVPLPTYSFQEQRYWIEPGRPQDVAAAGAGATLPTRAERLEDWFWTPAWRREDAPGDARADAAPNASWLVFVDDTGLGDEVVTRLRARGRDVTVVRAGDAFAKLGDDEYVLCPEHGPSGYHALVQQLLASGRAPARVVHLWLLADGETFRPGSSFLHRNQERGFWSLLFLAQALAAEETPRPLHVDVVSRGMQSVAGERLPNPDMATVLGPVKVIPRELPGVTCKSIDLGAPDDGVAARVWDLARSLVWEDDERAEAAPLVDALVRELELPPASELVALRTDAPSDEVVSLRLPRPRKPATATERWVQRYERLTLDGAPAGWRVPLRTGGIYLLTGGLGGIGASLANALAREHRARLAIVGRTELPDRDRWDELLLEQPHGSVAERIRAVRSLEAAGAQVLYAAADVADAQRMGEVLADVRARFGRIDGVFHAAGLLDDGPLSTKEQAGVESVFGPKLYGTLVLDELLRGTPLDFFVVFSSSSVAVAPAGQVDYVAANAFLEAWAESARAQGRAAQALAWGVWADVGMAAHAAERMGIEPRAAGASTASPAPTNPLFTSKDVRPTRGGVLRARLSAQGTWFVDEHRTAGGQAVVPGTAYLELARAALRELGEQGPFTIEDLFFFRPLRVPDDEALEVELRLRPTDDGYRLEVRDALGEAAAATALLHPSVEGPPPPPLDLDAIDARCDRVRLPDDPAGHRLKQEDHLAFGPRWRSLRRGGYGAREALAHLVLPDRFASDVGAFGLHPALLDVATGFALALAPGYDAAEHANDLWVPVSYARVRAHADLPGTVACWARPSQSARASSGDFAAFDLVLTDERGRVLVEIEQLTMRRLPPDGLEREREDAPNARRSLEAVRPGRGPLSPSEVAFQHALAQGITAAEGVRALSLVLAAADAPARLIVSSMDLRALARQAEELATRVSAPETTFSRPQLDVDLVAPRNDVERTLVGFWENLLGVKEIGVRDNFFELGGHSLVAVRLFAKIKKTWNVEFPISILFEAPTIEACAKLIAEALGQALGSSAGEPAAAEPPDAPEPSSEPAPADDEAPRRRFKHAVAMHPDQRTGAGKLPFFLVAGMFGNVLNLRHVAQLIGSDRPFYGLQARGLLGSEPPHETFEEAARDYLEEVRRIQPHGPYVLGGFSGGGITAYEMARQLRDAGEDIALVVLLDTPLPKNEALTRADRLRIHAQNFARQGPSYAVDWVRGKRRYRAWLAAREAERQRQEHDPDRAGFRSRVIEAAFYRSLERYDLVPQPIDVALFRPRLKPAHELGPGRAVNADRRFIYHDNGWGPYVKAVEVFEVPGDHDSMVLEPHVRPLAARLRACLDRADALAHAAAIASRGDAASSRYAGLAADAVTAASSPGGE